LRTFFRSLAVALFALSRCPADDAQLASVFDHAEDLWEAGSLNEARPLYEQLIPKLRAHGDQRRLAYSENHLGEIDLAQGKYSDALAHSVECRTLFGALHQAPEECQCWTLAGEASLGMSDYAGTVSAFEHGLDLARANGLSESRVTLLNNIGNVSFYLGKYSDAYRYYQEAEAQLAAHSREPWAAHRRGVNTANLATLYQRLGQYDKALQLYARLRSTQKTLSPREQAQLIANMGALYRRLGDPVKALEAYKTAQALFAVESDRDGEIAVLKNSGIALALDLGRLDQAAALFEQSLRMAGESHNRRQSVQAALYLGETLRRMGRMREAQLQFNQALGAATELNSLEDQWKAQYGLGQVAQAAGQNAAALELYLSAVRAIEAIRSGVDAPSMRVGFLADKRDVYDAAIGLLLKQPKQSKDDIFRLLEKAKARSFQDQVKGLPRDPRLSGISADLPAGTLLLDFWISGSQAAVIWIDHAGSGVEPITAPAAAEMDQLSAELANGTGDGWRTPAASISAKVLQPLRALNSRGYRRIVIVPDGRLQALPFEVLSDPSANGSKLLIENYEISYLPAASLAGRAGVTQESRWASPWRTLLAGFANPVITPETAQGSVFPASLDQLPASTQEVTAIAKLLGGRAELHTGSDDLKTYIRDAKLRLIPALHLATHAVADTDDPERSRILFSPERPGGPADFLFTREIYALDLHGVRLAMLSACDTEQGKTVRGEGVQSFSRALLAAGVSSAVTALWRVGDQAGAEFSKRFYRRLSEGQTAAAALRSAKLEFYRSSSAARHPRYWSVFVLNGDPDTRVPSAIPWTAFLVPIALAAAMLFGWMHLRRARSGRTRIAA
jgi:CHAT domain-containing protein/tetratricopeptide (TPR) repeat protein